MSQSTSSSAVEKHKKFLFPAATVLFLYIHLSLDYGSILLMAMGAQWYILFNSIAGAMAVPNDLREMAATMRLNSDENGIDLSKHLWIVGFHDPAPVLLVIHVEDA